MVIYPSGLTVHLAVFVDGYGAVVQPFGPVVAPEAADSNPSCRSTAGKAEPRFELENKLNGRPGQTGFVPVLALAVTTGAGTTTIVTVSCTGFVHPLELSV